MGIEYQVQAHPYYRVMGSQRSSGHTLGGCVYYCFKQAKQRVQSRSLQDIEQPSQVHAIIVVHAPWDYVAPGGHEEQ